MALQHGNRAVRKGQRPAMALPLLVFVLGFGVIVMHALGHRGEHDCAAGHVHAGQHRSSAAPATDLPALTATTDHGEPSVLAAPALTADPVISTRDSGGHGRCNDPTAICLAVLTLGGILLGRAALRRRQAGPVALISASPGGWRPGMRDPPLRTGLLVARVSVLRI